MRAKPKRNWQKKDIRLVVEQDLCTMCGACIGLCPLDCMHFKDDDTGLYPEIDFDRCTNCGVCYMTCPGHEVNFAQLGKSFLPMASPNTYIGPYIHCYVGYAVNKEIRKRGSSGGLVSALLIYALESGRIRRALVTKMSENSPLETQPFVATSRKDILSAAGSKYAPAAVGAGLRSVLKGSGDFAIVGLPCHIHGIRKAQLFNAKLREHALTIGLFCCYGKTFQSTEKILQRLNVEKADVQRIDYRADGWPGVFRLTLKNGEIYSIPYNDAYSNQFAPMRCTVCSDMTAELADISCGDAWLPEYEEETIGMSIVVARSARGDELVQQAIAAGMVKLEPVSAEKVFESQESAIRLKKQQIHAHKTLFRIVRRTVPQYTQDLLQSGFRDYIKAVVMYAYMIVSRTSALPLLNKAVAVLKFLRGRRRGRFWKTSVASSVASFASNQPVKDVGRSILNEDSFGKP